EHCRDQRGAKKDGRALGDGQHPETPLDAGQVVRQPVKIHTTPLRGSKPGTDGSVHAAQERRLGTESSVPGFNPQSLSLPSTARCRFPSSDSAIPTARTASITYHQYSLGFRSPSVPSPEDP